MFMFFKKKKTIPSLVGDENQVYSYLKELYPEGDIRETAFVIEGFQIFVYADVLSCDDHASQVVFQIHQQDLEDPIIDPVYGIGNHRNESLQDACINFYHHDLSLLIQALKKEETIQLVARTQENHAFQCYASAITCHGKREGELPETFWDWIEEHVKKRLGNKRLYWIKLYCAKMDGKCEVDVRINDVKSIELGKLLESYVEGWDCLTGYHTEKQCFYFMQKDNTYVPSIFTREDIIEYTKKAIDLFENDKCNEDSRKLRVKLMKLCKDDSLGMELFGFLPEIYCKYTYSDIEYGEQLFLIQKGAPTIEMYQSQVRSFSYMDEVVRKHLLKDKVSTRTIQKVVRFSANYRAIQKALDEGKEAQELFTPGIGYFVREDYILR